MSVSAPPNPNPRRVAAGRLNYLKRKGFSSKGLQALREAAIRQQPWRFSTGPRSQAGKAKVALNGKGRQVQERSLREVRQDMAGLMGMMAGFEQNLLKLKQG